MTLRSLKIFSPRYAGYGLAGPAPLRLPKNRELPGITRLRFALHGAQRKYIRQFYEVPNDDVESAPEEKLDEAQQENRDRAEGLVAFLDQNPNLKSLCTIPICLELVCFVWSEKEDDLKFLQEMTEAQLYYYITAYMATRGYTKLGGDNDAESIDVNEALNHFENKFKALQQLAFTKMQTKSLLILPAEISEAASTFGLGEDELYRLSILNVSKEEARRQQKNHYFVHLSFQEFFAACELVRKLGRDNEIEKAEAIDWVAINKYFPRYRVMLGFVAGLTVNEALNAVWFGSEIQREVALNAFWQGLRQKVELMGAAHTDLLIDLQRSMGALSETIPKLLVARVVTNEYLLLDSFFEQQLKDELFPINSLEIFKKLTSSQLSRFYPKTEAFIIDRFKNFRVIIHERIELYVDRIGPAAATSKVMKEVVALLKDSDDYVFGYIIGIISGFGKAAETEEMLAWISECINSANLLQVKRAIRVAGELGAVAVNHELLSVINRLLQSNNMRAVDLVLDHAELYRDKLIDNNILDTIAQRLFDDDFRIREMIVKLISFMGPKVATPAILHGLANALADPNELIKLSAVRAITYYNALNDAALNEEVVQAFVDCINNPGHNSSQIIIGLRNLQQDSFTPELKHALFSCLLSDNSNLSRNASIEILAIKFQTMDREIISILILGLYSDNDHVCHNTMAIVIAYKHLLLKNDFLNAVSMGLFDDWVDVSTSMAEIIEIVGYEHFSAQIKRDIHEKLQQDITPVMKSILLRVKALFCEDVSTKLLSLIVSGLRDANDDVRYNMVMAVKNIGRPAGVSEILLALGDILQEPIFGMREACLKAIIAIGEPVASCLPIVESLSSRILHEDNDDEENKLIVVALKSIGQDAVTESLLVNIVDRLYKASEEIIEAVIAFVGDLDISTLSTEFVDKLFEELLSGDDSRSDLTVLLLRAIRARFLTPEIKRRIADNLITNGEVYKPLASLVSEFAVWVVSPELLQVIVNGLAIEDGFAGEASRVMLSYLGSEIVTRPNIAVRFADTSALLFSSALLNEPNYYLVQTGFYNLSYVIPRSLDFSLFENKTAWLAFCQDDKLYFIDADSERVIEYDSTSIDHAAFFAEFDDSCFDDECIGLMRETFYPEQFGHSIFPDGAISLARSGVGIFSDGEEEKSSSESQNTTALDPV